MPQPEDLRVAVLGVGAMGGDHVGRITERVGGARVTVICDPDLERAEKISAAAPGSRIVVDPFAAITADDVDALVLASPGPAHERQVLACLDAGKPVLCEKPLTTSPQSALAIVEREAALGHTLIQVGFMRRFDDEYVRLKGLIDDSSLGTPLLMHCVHRNPAARPHFDSAMMIRDSLVHEIDATRFLLGEEITAVTVLRPTPSSRAPDGLQDPLLVILETETGRLVDVEVFVNTGVAYEVRTEVVGERGSALIGLEVTPGFRERFAQAYDTEMVRWVQAVHRGAQTGDHTDGPGVWDGYAAAAVCEAGVRSLETGDRVEVDLAT